MTKGDQISSVSIGVAGALDHGAIAHIARAAEAAGFHALWVNDTPDSDALAALAAAAAVTTTLTLAVGVIPVDRRSVDEIVEGASALPQERLVLGLGSGQARKGNTDLVRNAVLELRGRTRARLAVGALGPKMRTIAVEDADGPLLSWLPPEVAAEQAAEAHQRKADTHVALYVRTAVQPEAMSRLVTETAAYAAAPAYSANFARLGVTGADTVLTPDDFADRLRRYRDAVDEVVLRAIPPTDDLADYDDFIARASAIL